MKKTNTKTKLKARRMWANYYNNELALVAVHKTRRRAQAGSGGCAFAEAVPVAVIPLDDCESLVCAAADAYFKAWNDDSATRKEAMRTALVAIGVLPKQRKGRK